jgi:hypothetical protein
MIGLGCGRVENAEFGTRSVAEAVAIALAGRVLAFGVRAAGIGA